ncbi:MAG: T9SS type A sorting domain-containing protein, partial [FCB group bacterium]
KSIFLTDNYIFVGTWSGIYLSTDNGINWAQKNNGLKYTYVPTFLRQGDYIFAGTNADFKNGCGLFRAKFSDITDVMEKDKSAKNLIYPNPASNFLNINSVNIIGKDILIYDMLGNKLMSTTAAGAETRINIESLQTGVYFVRIGEQTKIFVKE